MENIEGGEIESLSASLTCERRQQRRKRRRRKRMEKEEKHILMAIQRKVLYISSMKMRTGKSKKSDFLKPNPRRYFRGFALTMERAERKLAA